MRQIKQLSKWAYKITWVLFFAICLPVWLYFAVQNGNKARDMGIAKTGEVMLADQKAKIQVSSHSMAVTIGHAIANVSDNNEKVEVIRKLVDDIRFEDDKSGYYFVYENTTCVALPPKKAVQGKDMSDTKDKNGVYLIKELRDAAQKGGGFVTYNWPKPGAGDVDKIHADGNFARRSGLRGNRREAPQQKQTDQECMTHPKFSLDGWRFQPQFL